MVPRPQLADLLPASFQRVEGMVQRGDQGFTGNGQQLSLITL